MTLTPEALGWAPLILDRGFPVLVGPLWTRRDGAMPRFAMLAEERHTNIHGIVHGGMMMTFADTGLGLTVWEAVGRRPCVTIQFACQFLDATHPGEFVELEAVILRQSSSVVFVRGGMRVGTRMVGEVNGVWKLLRPPAQTGDSPKAAPP